MAITTPTQTLFDGVQFPECPRWHDGKLWFSDMLGRRVMTVDESGRASTIAEFDTRPSGLGFLPDNTLLVALYYKQHLVQIQDGKNRVYADLSVLGGNHLNDMIVDGSGRAYVGLRMQPPGFTVVDVEKNITDCLVLVDAAAKISIVARNLVTPNGLALSGDGKTLVVNESRAARLRSFPVLPDGSLGEARNLATISEGIPDGLCIDAEGAVWVATLDASSFVRISNEGKVLQRITLGENHLAIACTLGGSDRKTLFMMTKPCRLAESGILEDRGDPKRADGRIETARVEIPGAGFP